MKTINNYLEAMSKLYELNSTASRLLAEQTVKFYQQTLDYQTITTQTLLNYFRQLNFIARQCLETPEP